MTDGKAIGTYFEHKFRTYLSGKYTFGRGSSAKGIDFPDLEVDMKVTSIRQPQSSCPFKSARQKVFGLGYSLLVFVYDKTDDPQNQSGTLNVLHTIFIEAHRTADYQTTMGIRQILDNNGNADDLVAYFQDRNLPVDEIVARELARELLKKPPEIGYLNHLERTSMAAPVFPRDQQSGRRRWRFEDQVTNASTYSHKTPDRVWRFPDAFIARKTGLSCARGADPDASRRGGTDLWARKLSRRRVGELPVPAECTWSGHQRETH